MNKNQNGFVNRLLLLVVASTVLLLLLSGAAILLVKWKPFLKNFPFLAKEKYTGKVDMNKLEAEKKVVEVIIQDGKVSPSKTEIDTGKAVVFRNATNKDVNLNLKGNINAGLPIKAHSFIYSPIFNFPGKYEYEDLSNPSIKGEITVKDIPINKMNFKTAEIFISDSGFKPENLIVKKNIKIKFINNSSSDKEVNSIGSIVITTGTIKPGKSAEMIIVEPLKATFTLKEDPTKKGTITVE